MWRNYWSYRRRSDPLLSRDRKNVHESFSLTLMLSIIDRRDREDRDPVEVSNLYAQGHVLKSAPIRWM